MTNDAMTKREPTADSWRRADAQRTMSLSTPRPLVIGHWTLGIHWSLVIGHWSFFIALLTGCSFAPKYTRPPVQTPGAFKELGTNNWKTAQPMDDVIRGKWWEMFKEPELNALEEQIEVSNQNIAAAFANFLSARALVKQARAQLFPTVTAAPSVTRSRTRALSRQTSINVSPGGSTLTDYSLPLDASW